MDGLLSADPGHEDRATSEAEHLNGVDLDAVAKIAGRYREAPDTGRTRFEAQVSWLGGYRTEARLDGLSGLRGDEPEALAGTGTGPSPEAMLLAAAAQCLIVGVAGAASARGIAIETLTVEAAGAVNLAAAYGVQDGSPGFDRIELMVHLESPDADAPQLQALVDDALASAPIPNTIARPVPVTARLASAARRSRRHRP
jgi:organic hydroperoxide reductase OsmC/OhrA